MYRVGIDLGGSRIKIGLVRDGIVESYGILQATPNKGLKSLLPLLLNEIHRLCSITHDAHFESIGIAFPGLVNSNENRIISTSSKYTDAPSVDMVGWAKDSFGAILKMDNDARLACLGEWRYGAGRGISNMAMYTLGTGIGSAVVLEGKLLRGKHFQAAILGGHIVIDFKDKTHICSCGKYGCVEAVASMWMIEQLAKEHSLYPKSRLSEAGQVDWKTIILLSEKGDELSILLRQHCLNAWAVGLVNLVHAYDPERVVIGGGIIHNKEVILPYFKNFLEKHAWCPGGLPEIYAADFPDTAGLLGASALFE